MKRIFNLLTKRVRFDELIGYIDDEIEEEEWEAPSVWRCISTIFWGLLGYSEDA